MGNSAEGTLEACEKVCIVPLYQGTSAKGKWRGFVIEDGKSVTAVVKKVQSR